MEKLGARVAVSIVAALAGGWVALALGCSDSSSGSSRHVIERFVDAQDADSVTTAAWSLNGQPGLEAGYGFGGNGSDGALTVTGKLVLDSSDALAAAPGPDGLVEWNFSRLIVEPGGALLLTGARPIRLKVMGTCLIAGTVDASGLNGANAPAGTARIVGKLYGGRGGPGGGVGGTSSDIPNDQWFLYFLGAEPFSLRGGPGFPPVVPVVGMCGDPNRSSNRLITAVETNCGGGLGGNRGVPRLNTLRNGCSGNGGGHATSGYRTDALCQKLGRFGDSPGLAWATVTGPNQTELPTTGAGGGAGGNADAKSSLGWPIDDIVAGSGGGGGGGLEIECAGAITVAAGGSILANGGNGGIGFSTIVDSTTVSAGYGGGGAGGSIWLSATSVVVENGAVIAATGGVGNPAPPSAGSRGDGGTGYTVIRDLGGTPAILGAVGPAAPSERYGYVPAANGTSQAVSRWYDGRATDPAWSFNAGNPKTGEVIPGDDLVFAVPPGGGQTVHIDFQAALDKDGAPDPDTAHWWPPGKSTENPYAAWETNLSRIVKIGGGRWLRFRVRFDLGELSKSNSLLNQIVIKSIRVRQ